MAGTSNDSSSSSISPLSSPSSIVFVDLYGKRRQVAKVQVLEREIGLLQDEIKSLAELEVASRCCKELEDYVEATPDPLVVMFVVDPEAAGKIFGEKLARCYGVVAVVAVATQKTDARVFHVQKAAVVGVVERRHVAQDVASVPSLHATVAAILLALNVRFVAVVIHVHAFKLLV
ncbi:putative G-protein gamma [Helianthus annuus]|uniref:G-protein gamma n=1 Tax=Helianthus annuus TaxID=4232 RepID=A0A9K3IAX6_HELAN|nr:putative G-protein gamma [Helianthus annuus]KAJ0537186.1 putative G-protein gamma [Helianthus annuus]KAJ0890958.1 putative G-protein gamma [Helianthus annuus]